MINRRHFLRALPMVALAAVPVTVNGHAGTRRETAPGQFVFCFPEMHEQATVEQVKSLLVSKGYVQPVVVGGSATRYMEIFKLEGGRG